MEVGYHMQVRRVEIHVLVDARPSTRAIPNAIDAKPPSKKNKKHVILERPACGVVGIEHRVDS